MVQYTIYHISRRKMDNCERCKDPLTVIHWGCSTWDRNRGIRDRKRKEKLVFTEEEARKIVEDTKNWRTDDYHYSDYQIGLSRGIVQGIESERGKVKKLEEENALLKIELNEHHLTEHLHVDCCDNKVHESVFKQNKSLQSRIERLEGALKELDKHFNSVMGLANTIDSKFWYGKNDYWDKLIKQPKEMVDTALSGGKGE